MSTESKLKHSLIFKHDDNTNVKNTYDDWHLIPTKKPVIALPAVRQNYIEVLGRNGDLDSTEVFGKVVYGMREGSIEFLIEKYDTTFEDLIHEVATYLHGQYRRVILEDDPNRYYVGRWAINEARTDESYSVITLDYKLQPFCVNIQTGVKSL